jgi:hypothetical protein
LTNSERTKLIELERLKYRRQKTFNQLTCIHTLTEYEQDLLVQELQALEERLAAEEV